MPSTTCRPSHHPLWRKRTSSGSRIQWLPRVSVDNPNIPVAMPGDSKWIILTTNSTPSRNNTRVVRFRAPSSRLEPTLLRDTGNRIPARTQSPMVAECGLSTPKFAWLQAPVLLTACGVRQLASRPPHPHSANFNILTSDQLWEMVSQAMGDSQATQGYPGPGSRHRVHLADAQRPDPSRS